MDPVSGVFTSIPGVRTPVTILDTPAPIIGTRMAPATATATAGPAPHRGSGKDWSSDAPQERVIRIAEEVERGAESRARYAATYGPNWPSCRQSAARGLCS